MCKRARFKRVILTKVGRFIKAYLPAYYQARIFLQTNHAPKAIRVKSCERGILDRH